MTSEDLRRALRRAFDRARDLDGSLEQRLAAYSDAIRDLHPDYARAVDQLVARLLVSGAGTSAPQPGDPMPPFALPDENGRLASLDQLTSAGPLAVMFHRGHWCPWCRISLDVLADAQQEVTRNGSIVAIVPERAPFAATFKAEAKSPFPVLTDMDNGYALLLNLAIWVGPELEHLLTDLGRVLPDYQGNAAWMLPIPAAFVVDRAGIVRHRFLDPDFRRRVAVDDLVAALRDAR